MNIYIFTDPFPTWSQTFIYDEIVGLESLNHKIRIVALFKERFVNHPILRKIKTHDIHYISSYKNIEDVSFSSPRNIWHWMRFLATDFIVNPFSLSRNRRSWRKYIVKNFIDNRFHFFQTDTLRELVSSEKADLFLVHFGALGEIFIWLKKEFNIPYIVFFHGCEFNSIQRKRYNDYKELFCHADHFLVKSKYTLNKIVELGGNPDKITILPFGINPKYYRYHSKETRKNATHIKILGVGRLEEFKDFELALEVIKKCIKTYPMLQYDIIGNGPSLNDLKNKIQSLGLEKVCFLRGAKNTNVVSSYMSNADIYLQPVRTDTYGETETFGNTLLEAQLHGLPVVSTNVGGVPETVIHDKTGLLAPESDSSALSEFLTRFIGNAKLRKSFGECGRENVLLNFDSNKRIIELDQILSNFH